MARFSAPLVCSNFCRKIRPRSVEHGFYAYHALDHMYRRGEFFAIENGTTGIKNLPFASFSTSPLFLLPPVSKLTEFRGAVAPLSAKMDANGAESETLAELRDTLLPKLISGELRIPEAEEIVSSPTQLELPQSS